jgi:glycosyltransferase involved in cell wall biosynthesis
VPGLSVISPAYNQEEWIIPFLGCVAAQTWRDFEFIIIDDHSTDRTAALIEAYLPRLGRQTQFIRHEKNQGAMVTVTEAFSKSTGDICIKLDADGVFGPDTFAKIMDSFAGNERVGIVTALVKAADRSNWILRGTEILCAARQRHSQLDGKYTTTAYGNCFAFRRHIFSKEEILSRTDVDLSHLARKRGWCIVLRKDVTVRTRFPTTVHEAFGWGRRQAWANLPTYWHHKEILLSSSISWARFAPLGLALTALFRCRLAWLGLLGWLAACQVFLTRMAPDYPVSDRLAGWGVTVVRWSGFDLEVLLMAARAVIHRLGLDK